MSKGADKEGEWIISLGVLLEYRFDEQEFWMTETMRLQKHNVQPQTHAKSITYMGLEKHLHVKTGQRRNHPRNQKQIVSGRAASRDI